MENKEIFKCIGDEMTVRLNWRTPKHLRFYIYRKTRICITVFDTLLPEVWYRNGSESLARLGYTDVNKLGEMLVSYGAKQIKAPAPRRRSDRYGYNSIYD